MGKRLPTNVQIKIPDQHIVFQSSVGQCQVSASTFTYLACGYLIRSGTISCGGYTWSFIWASSRSWMTSLNELMLAGTWFWLTISAMQGVQSCHLKTTPWMHPITQSRCLAIEPSSPPSWWKPIICFLLLAVTAHSASPPLSLFLLLDLSN